MLHDWRCDHCGGEWRDLPAGRDGVALGRLIPRWCRACGVLWAQFLRYEQAEFLPPCPACHTPAHEWPAAHPCPRCGQPLRDKGFTVLAD